MLFTAHLIIIIISSWALTYLLTQLFLGAFAAHDQGDAKVCLDSVGWENCASFDLFQFSSPIKLLWCSEKNNLCSRILTLRATSSVDGELNSPFECKTFIFLCTLLNWLCIKLDRACFEWPFSYVSMFFSCLLLLLCSRLRKAQSKWLKT